MSEQSPQQPQQSKPEGASTSTGLDPNMAGLLAYLVGWVSGLILFLVEKEHQEVRFHAAQSLIVSVAIIALYIVLGVFTFVPVVGLLIVALQVLLGLGFFALWIFLLVKGYRLDHVKLPVAGDLAERWAANPPV